MRLLRIFLHGALLTGVAAAASCGGEGDVADNRVGGSGASSGTGNDASAGSSGVGGFLLDGQAGSTGSECSADSDCDGGVCAGGTCCPTIQRACGSQCCAEGDFCSFDKCVVPGKPCQNPADCDEDQYCETSLGENADGGGAGGLPGDAGTVCTQPVASAGRCIDLPPICGEGDAGAPDAGGCVERCEFVPQPGTLEPVIKWQWGYSPAPTAFPAFADVWNTPAVGRVWDADCDGDVDESDPPNVVFVSGNNETTCCHCNGKTPHSCLTGVLRVLDGRTGQELASLDKAKPGAFGFAGVTVALGDIDGDSKTDIIALTGDGYVVHVDWQGKVVTISDQPVDPAATGSTAFGWGGGLSLGDMDADGQPEIAFGRTLYATGGGAITRLWVGANGKGGTAPYTAMSFFADVDGASDGALELVAGNTAYRKDGTTAWVSTVQDGFGATGDFDADGLPEVVVAERGRIHVLEGATGVVELTATMPDSGGGAPTVADFNGDGEPEIGVAQQNVYVMMKPNYAGSTIDVQWTAPTHDLSSNVTGSSVFDFDGDGKAEVVYNDECFLWVYDGTDGTVLLAELTQSFTGTEASIVADVDGDGHAEIVMISNGANPTTWTCNVAPWNQPDPPRPAWTLPAGASAYRGITVFGDRENSWVGTRTVWNQHSYFVTNVCDSRDSACDPPNVYGSVPTNQKKNWQLPWLNNFRQNVQDKGLFDAPDVVLELQVFCTNPVGGNVRVRNIGLSGLPAGVEVGVFSQTTGTRLATVTTSKPLLPGQSELIPFADTTGMATSNETFVARVIIDPLNKTFNECREDNNESNPVTPSCGPQ